ncbi:T6SS immunity protein Tli4 family protein [Azonexus caeni]|uniref:T6SS immunity protein Tli4 family protein n=1 Tax=Azonexus caeni TaxID=266126 RepID=UPI003A882659
MRKKWIVLLIFVICGSAGCAETVPAEWPKECVGRLQLALPGKSDQAAYLFSELFRNHAQYGQPYMRFPDGEPAGLSQFSIADITHPLNASEKNDALNKFIKIQEKIGDSYKEKVRNVSTGKLIGKAWVIQGKYVGLDALVNNSVFLWGQETASEIEFTHVEDKLKSLINALRPRPLFDVPAEPGLCLPYVFIPDGGQGGHAIAMTYRLKEHPDITINLRSKTAESTPKEGDNIRPDAVTNDFQTDLYWGAYLANVVDARSLWHLPAKRPMHMAGRSGLETFLAVVRSKDSEEDYIYHAVARGDPDEPEKAPDVRLVVEQNRQNAIKRGIQPLTQDEVLKLSRQIAASVAVRKNK